MAAPYFTSPSTRDMPNRAMAPAAMSQRIFRTRSSSRKNTPNTRKKMMPRVMASSCLSTEEGAEEADRVDRKKAMVSISKPMRPNPRMIRQ